MVYTLLEPRLKYFKDSQRTDVWRASDSPGAQND